MPFCGFFYPCIHMASLLHLFTDKLQFFSYMIPYIPKSINKRLTNKHFFLNNNLVLMEQNQLEMQVHGTAGHFDVAANVGVKDSGGIRVIYKGFQILLLEKETCRSAVIDVKCG